MDREVYKRMSDLEMRHWWFVGRREILADLIRRLVRPKDGARILEAGCGSGGNLGMLSRFGQVDAFEYDEAARAIASERAGHEIPFGALPDELPVGGPYDLIGMFDVLEHVEADGRSLKVLADQLAPGGKLLITVPAFPALWSQHDETHHHFRRYTRNSLTSVASQAGLRVIYASYFNSLLFPLALAARFAKKLTGSKTPDDSLPMVPANWMLTQIFRAERHLLGRVSLPAGLSLIAVLERR